MGSKHQTYFPECLENQSFPALYPPPPVKDFCADRLLPTGQPNGKATDECPLSCQVNGSSGKATGTLPVCSPVKREYHHADTCSSISEYVDIAPV